MIAIRLAASITVALICTSGVAFAQWLRHPTADVPRTADGKPNLAAPPPRLADGKPDFSGIWQPGRKIQCTPEFSKFVDCGIEIGGSPLALNMGTDMPGGLPYQPWAAALVKQRTADKQQGRSARVLSTRQSAEALGPGPSRCRSRSRSTPS